MTEEQRIKRNQRQEQWKKENRERFNLLLPIGTKNKIFKAAEAKNIKASQWIDEAIREKMNRENITTE